MTGRSSGSKLPSFLHILINEGTFLAIYLNYLLDLYISEIFISEIKKFTSTIQYIAFL